MDMHAVEGWVITIMYLTICLCMKDMNSICFDRRSIQFRLKSPFTTVILEIMGEGGGGDGRAGVKHFKNCPGYNTAHES